MERSGLSCEGFAELLVISAGLRHRSTRSDRSSWDLSLEALLTRPAMRSGVAMKQLTELNLGQRSTCPNWMMRLSSPGTNFLKAEDRSPPGKGMFLDFFPAQGNLTQPSNRWVYLICFDSTGDQRWKPFWLEKKRSTAKTVLSWIRSGRISIVQYSAPRYTMYCLLWGQALHSSPCSSQRKRTRGAEASLVHVCMRHGVEWSLGSPRNSRFFEAPFSLSVAEPKRGI